MPGNRLDDELLSNFMREFYGYGNPDAPRWFVGMEEGGGSSIEELHRRLSSWSDRGSAPFEDLVEYHRAIRRSERFDGPKPKIQRTWRGLIHISLGLTGGHIEREAVRDIQRAHWARSNGNVCLLELLPLPSPSTAVWHYSKWSTLPDLENRSKYTEAVIHLRIARIQALIKAHKPTSVVFYGKKYLAHWQEITGADLWTPGQPVTSVNRGVPIYVCMNHPARSGDAHFHQVAEFLRFNGCISSKE